MSSKPVTRTMQAHLRRPAFAGRDDLLFCRVSDSWTILAHPMQFDHDTSAFPLRGQHRDAACRLCDATLGGEYVLDNTMNSIRYFIECGFRF